MGAFEKNDLTFFPRLVDGRDHISEVRTEASDGFFNLSKNSFSFKGREIVVSEGAIRFFETSRDEILRNRRIAEVCETQADPIRLIGIRRADAALGGAYFLITQRHLTCSIKLTVIGEDNVGAI